MTAWIKYLNKTLLADYHTCLAGGFKEPFYRAPSNRSPAEIQFKYDFERSALHELAHWCIAGEKRRQRDDYGYWYEPDGRNHKQQQLFFSVEIKPQAIEKHFCHTLDIPFDVSVDNLGHNDPGGIGTFRTAVDKQHRAYLRNGLPGRAAAICRQIHTWRLQR